MFYEKKALRMDKLTDSMMSNCLHIDMQMNLSEFLYKIMPANIYDKDVQEMLSPDDHLQIHKQLTGQGMSQNRQSTFSLDRFKVNVAHTDATASGSARPLIELNLVTATALLEEAMNQLDRGKYYEKELAKRDLIIRRAVVNHCYEDAGERMSSFIRSKGEINEDVKSLLVGEVPRLILSEYQSCHHKNRQLEEEIDELRGENHQLSSRIQLLESELARTNSEHRVLIEEYQDLARKFQTNVKKSYTLQRANSELAAMEQADLVAFRE